MHYRVLVGFPQRSFAAQACSAEFVCFCTCDLQTRHCDQAVADRLGNSIGYQSYFQYARALQEASQSHPVFAQGSIDAAPRSRFDSAECEICSIFRFDPGLPVDGATYMLWLPFVTAIASGSISLRSDDYLFGGMQVAGGRTRSVSAPPWGSAKGSSLIRRYAGL